MSTIPFTIPAHSKPISLAQARVDLPPEEFRRRLRSHLLAHPGLTLAQVARELKTSRQYVSQSVGKLNRPDVTSPLFMHLSPRAEAAKAKLPELIRLVSRGLTVKRAAAQLDVSVFQSYRAGFRSRPLRVPAHGTQVRAAHCNCWRCRRASGTPALRSAANPAHRLEVLDWLAWTDPYGHQTLTQQEIAHLTGTNQGTVSRIAQAVEAGR